MNSPTQLQAIALALSAYTFWVLADTSLKLLGHSNLPFYQIIAGVGLAMVLLLLLQAAFTRNLAALRPNNLGSQLLRAALDLANNIGVVIALRHLPIALFYILVFAAPMVTTLLAAAFLSEPLELKKGIAITLGFLGVVIAVNPFALTRPGDLTGYLACLGCVAAFSTSTIWSRRLTQTETPQSLTFVSAALMVLTGGAAMLFHADPITPRLTLTFSAAGLFCVLGSLCFFAALKHAAAATVTQFHYTQLLTGALIGYLLWHERLTPSMLAGATLIIAAGVFTAARTFSTRNAAEPQPI